MNNRIYLLGGISLVLVISAIAYYAYALSVKPVIRVTSPITETEVAEETLPLAVVTPVLVESMIIVTSPTPNVTIKSPMIISGEARGMWYFEGSFPVELRDAEGKTIATSIATTAQEWMTEEFVPFTSTLTWASTTATNGILILKRDNPSGIPENDDSISIPVSF